MITKITGEQPFQVLTNNFSISPSDEGYTLQISADGENYSNLFSVSAGVTRLVTGVAANSYYKLSGNASEVSINWMKTCVTEGGGGGTSITVDTALSSSSTNPVENRVITNKFDDYYTKSQVEAKGYLTGITTSDPNVVISGNNINLAERLAHYKENLVGIMKVVDANGGQADVYSGTTGSSGSEHTFYYSDVLSDSLDMSATPILLRIDVSETSTPYYIYSSFAGDGGYENLFTVSLNDNTGVTGIPDGGNCRIGMVTDGNSNIAAFLESGFTYSEADYYVTESEATSAVSSVTTSIEQINTRFSDYYTKADIDSAGYATQEDINTSLDGYATEGYVDSAIAGIPFPSVPVDVSELNNDAGYVTQEDIDESISGKADTTAVTQEIQTAIDDYVSKVELTGNTETVELELTERNVGYTYKFAYGNMMSTVASGSMKDTNVDSIKAIRIGDETSSMPMDDGVSLYYFNLNGTNYIPANNTIGSKVSLVQGGSSESASVQYPSITASEMDGYYFIVDLSDMTVLVTNTLPTITTGTPGILDDYYTKSEIDTMVGDIETLLENI